MLRNRFSLVGLLLLVCIVSISSFAQTSNIGTPTPQQIEQFKRLPQNQQRILAQQLGIDYNQIQRMMQMQGINQSTPLDTEMTSIYPRGTEFDALGNPTLYQNPLDNFLEIEPEEIQPFGYDLFAGAPSTFAPTFDAPVPNNYILGPGDNLQLQLYGKENNQYQLTVDREGLLTIPSLKPVKLAGLTFSEAKSYVANLIQQNMIGIESHLSMGELRSIRVFVLGEAFKPGAYTVSSLTTMTQALFVSGGVNDIASLRNIQLKRGGKVVQTLDLYDLLNHGDTSSDEILQSGDVVFIPTLKETITVKGQVRRPAIYEVRGETTFADAIELAGGYTSDAFSSSINVRRFDRGAVKQITVSETEQNKKVRTGDIIEVSGVSDTVAEAITLIGAVARPGNLQWQPDSKISDFIGSRHKDLLNETDLNYALLLRNYRTGKDLEVLQFSPSRLLAGDLEHDFPLQIEDILVFFSLIETKELGNQDLEELAFTKQDLEQQEKENWKKRIEQKLFWQQIGFEAILPDEFEGAELDSESITSTPMITLTEMEREKLDYLKDATAFSRKRLLAPVIEKLRVHASFSNPLKLVEISGSVRFPGLYPLPDNGTINDIFIAAGGLSESAYAHQSELTRYFNSSDGEMVVQNINFVPAKVVAGEENLTLKSRDRINVYRNPEWQEQLQVELKGEVAFPGTYTIRRGETLSSVIQRAGGLTEYADANASIFLRESLKRQESQNLRKLTEDLRKEIASEGLRTNSSGGSLVSYTEVQKLLRDLTNVRAVGRLVIDLPDLLSNENNQDLPLEDGDRLIIPGKNKTVNVIGEVFVPTSHLFNDGLSFSDYIELSGGFKALAADERAYIIKANGSVVIPNKQKSYWYQSSEQKVVYVSPGDTIVVPYDSSHVDNLTLWTSGTQIAYQLAVTLAAIGNL